MKSERWKWKVSFQLFPDPRDVSHVVQGLWRCLMEILH